MKVVLCDGAPSLWLSTDREFTVLAVESAHFRLWADKEDSCALFPVSQFKLVDARISRYWQADGHSLEFGKTDFGPVEWHSPGFWDAYYDRDPQANEVFQRCMQQMLSEFET